MTWTTLTREEILASDDLPRERVDVPEWGGAVYVRALTGAERDAFEVAVLKERPPLFRPRLVCYCACDKDGAALFRREDLPTLAQRSGAALDRVFDVAMRLNRMRQEDRAELEQTSPSANGTGG